MEDVYEEEGIGFSLNLNCKSVGEGKCMKERLKEAV